MLIVLCYHLVIYACRQAQVDCVPHPEVCNQNLGLPYILSFLLQYSSLHMEQTELPEEWGAEVCLKNCHVS